VTRTKPISSELLQLPPGADAVSRGLRDGIALELLASEADFTAAVLEYAGLRGWKTAHFRPARTRRGWRTAVQGDGLGFPDLVLLRGAKLLVCELKTKRGTLAPAQRAWLEAWKEAGADVRVWRPSDWDTIERVLA
jgi:hypothetical protein